MSIFDYKHWFGEPDFKKFTAPTDLRTPRSLWIIYMLDHRWRKKHNRQMRKRTALIGRRRNK